MRRFFHRALALPLAGAATSSVPVAFCAPRSYCTPKGTITVGNPDTSTIRTPMDSEAEISDIIGISTVGTEIQHRLPAGEVLGLMDICAARAAIKHMRGNSAMQDHRDFSVATVAIDNTTFKFPLLHGDLVKVRGTVVNVGSSSIAVRVETTREQFPTRKEFLVNSSYFFMVAIEKSGPDGTKIAPVKNAIPGLRIEDPKHVSWYRQSVSAKQGQRLLAEEFKSLSTKDIKPSDFETDVTRAKIRKVTFESTKTAASRLFFPQHLNLNKTIFGGEIIRWMEQHAVHCGRMFCGNRAVFTIGMHSCEFQQPILLTDWVSLSAHVVYVHNTTMEIDVELKIESEGGEEKTTNRASFIVTNFDDVGQRRLIDNGLDLENASEAWLRRYACAQHRYNVSRHRCMLDPAAWKATEAPR